MFMLTNDGWKSLGGFKQRIADDWLNRHRRINAAQIGVIDAYNIVANNVEDETVKHHAIRFAYTKLSQAQDALLGAA